jgi:hypothetical protein
MSEAVSWASGSGSDVTAAKGAAWIDAELAGCALGDIREVRQYCRTAHQAVLAVLFAEPSK